MKTGWTLIRHDRRHRTMVSKHEMKTGWTLIRHDRRHRSAQDEDWLDTDQT